MYWNGKLVRPLKNCPLLPEAKVVGDLVPPISSPLACLIHSCILSAWNALGTCSTCLTFLMKGSTDQGNQ